jgi:proteasome accessory factor B
MWKEKFSRPPWARMLKIHEWIQNGLRPNCAGMALELEVSRRTMKRDIEFMRERLNLPVEYDSQRHGYYYSKPVDRFPGMPVTEAEIFALLVAHKAIAQYGGTPFARPLRTAFRKLTWQLDSHEQFSLENLQAGLSFRPFAPEDADLQAFQLITQALQEQRALRFCYRKLGARGAQFRHVHPYHLACIENHWYLFAYDVDRQAIRTFALARLAEPKLTGKRFSRPGDFDPDEYLRGSFTVLKGRDDYEVMIEFDAWATDLVRGRQWHSSQDFIELPGAGSQLRLRLNSLEEIERWVLNWGAHATVVRPKALAERIRKTAEAVARRYAVEAFNC